ncbi:protein-L-isoaspartate O-methyltransferase [Oceanobacter sp. RED65]|uniref:Protein-L-isoaspartate O-methyltransferase n=2 Tax=Bermanella marisrubri TaxID=207949 RepID=Q1N1K3_9GAMM|nr:protein-L-isoaspartate O-methyltransferase [Oceanobacter sp. RED65] [Bermanella marisrubri]
MTPLQLQGIGMTSQRTRDRLVDRLKERGIRNPDVLEVIANTPRHIFVDEALSHRAYEDTALPIGFGQTISQPYIVARMTEILLEQGPLESVLEIGTGCGYQAVVLAQLVNRVYSVERIAPLQQKAKDRMKLLRANNVKLKHADGNWGWSDEGPFDAILSAAAPDHIPVQLAEQLKVGGQLIIPIGDERKQVLTLVTRNEDGFSKKIIEDVMFVPMLSGTQK